MERIVILGAGQFGLAALSLFKYGKIWRSAPSATILPGFGARISAAFPSCPWRRP